MPDSSAAPVVPPTVVAGAPQPPWTPLQPFKGALIAIDRTNPSAKTVVAFQYNPLGLSRELKGVYPQKTDPHDEGAPATAARETPKVKAKAPMIEDDSRFAGTASQTISLTITLDASDDGGPTSGGYPAGILPQLAALELLINPKSSDVSSYIQRADSSTIVVLPNLAPRILFVWGPNRVLPVKIGSLSVQEKEFNSSLNPIFAEVTLQLTVCPFDRATSQELSYLLTNLQKLETMSALAAAPAPAIGVDPSGLT